MYMRCLMASGAVALWLFVANLSAAGSEVADAVMRGDTAAVRALLAQKVDVNATQTDGATALHWAVYRGDHAMADLLLQAGANPKAANRDGATVLSLASINGDAVMISKLLQAGADPNDHLPQGETALMLASRTGSLDAMKVLLDRGADVNVKEKVRGTTALMWAVDESHPAAVQLLIDRGANVSAASNPAPKGRSAGLGKAGDPRKGRTNQEQNALRQDQTATDVARAAQGQSAQRAPAAQADQAAQAAALVLLAATGDLAAGGLTPLVFAARQNDLESARILLAAGADVNQVTHYGWSPLLVATHNRNYKLASFLLDKGANPSLANNGGWTPLYLAVDNRNIEGGDYPVRKGDMDHLEIIKKLLDKGANVNARIKDVTDTRTTFTQQWVDENGATAFFRASQSSDLVVMRLLLASGADPKIATVLNVTPLQVAAGIGWAEGLTYEWSEQANVEAVKLLLDLGIDPNLQADTGRTALHGAGHKGRPAVIQLLVDHGARLETRDYGMTGNDAGGRLENHAWQPVDYADGLVRVGVQSAIAHAEAGLLFRKLMKERGLYAPPMGRTLTSVCLVTEVCQ